jgi:hypothetical protein
MMPKQRKRYSAELKAKVALGFLPNRRFKIGQLQPLPELAAV